MIKGVTLRGLEVFEALAQSGSVAQAAQVTGLSQPAVSQQLRNLESALGVELVDHGRRPMTLTPAGQNFLTRTETILSQLRLAQSELTVMDLSHLSTLSVGMIDDFDNDLTPRLVTLLTDSLKGCGFRMITAPSLDLITAVQERRLHIVVTASSGEMLDGVVEYPLVRDPFMLVVPRGQVPQGAQAVDHLSELPFLRYDRDQLISRQIEAHLTRNGMQFAERFEIGSHLALMAMVARRIGWAVTTPLGYMRAERFHDEIDAYPLPFADATRVISLFAGSDWAEQVPRDLAATMRQLLQSHMIGPVLARQPWLNGSFRLIGA